MPKRKQETESTSSFEATIEALHPFIKGYAVAPLHRVKIWLNENYDKVSLDTELVIYGEQVRRNANVLFVDYGELDAEEARSIVARVMGDNPDSAA